MMLAASVWESLSLAATGRLHRTSAGLALSPRHGDKWTQMTCSLWRHRQCEIRHDSAGVSGCKAELWNKGQSHKQSVLLWLLSKFWLRYKPYGDKWCHLPNINPACLQNKCWYCPFLRPTDDFMFELYVVPLSLWWHERKKQKIQQKKS